jgi:non-canonical (house-cleaning) NTP pyrophosphatase
MAKKLQAWTKFRPRLERTNPMTSEELIENLVAATNKAVVAFKAVLAELDVQIESGLKSGRIVKLPNSTLYQPIWQK